MEIRKKFIGKLLFVYLVSTAMVLMGSGVLLNDQWNDSIENAGVIAQKDLDIASGTTRNILLNASKLLDITNRDLHQLIATNKYEAKAIQKAISGAASIFSLDNEVKNYGILAVTNKDGLLIARSDDAPISGINFSDRYYFQTLKNHPEKSFVIGPLLLARTTQKRVFHLAVPIRDTHGQFNGALVLQISEDSVVRSIRQITKNPDEVITALTENNEIIFSTLTNEIHPNSNIALNSADAFQGLKINSDDSWVRNNNTIVANLNSPELQIKFISTESIAELFADFLNSNAKVFFLAGISYTIFTYLMWFIYRQFIQAENARILSSTDQLTQLPNRRAFDERYELFLKDSIRSRSDISILFIDIDKFKNCNDDYGHENGDIVLKRLAEILQSCMRRPFDFCCRWGGEELVALLPDTNEAGASNVAQQILDTVRTTPIEINGHPPIHITVSIGIACAHQHQPLPENNLVDRADQAMYRAKQAGRDRYSL
ncbi:sensor domain-containing diguanylate cyclase [Polynucleobacter sp. AP-Reno-20A-A9]|uniref:sensor domain-containing diguanylate cyclase n=1 Tax=Polynucleobacter sp. AP-Reno-20A-A9 TaxID=2576925 RepID=UPI001C0C95E0|nr:sensor domain-containing diguanylate cyclase [Polynucleobacter sp. AP-Reno-20A-A9]MBU3629100.1 diguanylate cyclase [Polynucleobacter sp. AP-Reno-20A-A9]